MGDEEVARTAAVNKSTKIGDILTEDQCKEVERILSEYNDAISPELATALKKYLGTQEKELLAKGVLPDFLAYAILNAIYDISRNQS